MCREPNLSGVPAVRLNRSNLDLDLECFLAGYQQPSSLRKDCIRHNPEVNTTPSPQYCVASPHSRKNPGADHTIWKADLTVGEDPDSYGTYPGEC